MGLLGNIKEKATDLAQAGVAQSKRLAEIAKLKTANMGEEDTIKRAYIELGKLYYAEKGTSPEGAYAAACEKITAAKAAIETNNDRIAELKADGGDDETADEQPAEPAEEVQEEAVSEAAEAEEAAEAKEAEEEPKAEE